MAEIASALLRIWMLVGLGYYCKARGIISDELKKGIAVMTGTIVLPALLFYPVRMCNLHLRQFLCCSCEHGSGFDTVGVSCVSCVVVSFCEHERFLSALSLSVSAAAVRAVTSQ